MWFQPLSHWILMAAIVSQPTAGPSFTPPAPPSLPEVIPTRQSAFTIPFRVEPSSDPTWQPVEAQLFVSTDRGTRWNRYTKAPTAEQRFPFRAGGDGEYWFAVRTADRAGRVRPESISGPGLRVLVDTKSPALTLKAESLDDGRVMVRWKIDELHPKPNSLKISYRTSSNGSWATVPVDPQNIRASAGSQAGETTFRPTRTASSSEIAVRAEVMDTAGNSATANAVAGPGRGGESSGNEQPDGSVSLAINPPIGSRYGAAKPSADRTPSFPGLPPGERPRMVNSRTFELEYDVDSVGPSGIGRVELWCTRDGGQTWRSLPSENDSRSRLRVKVEDEGVSGFRVAVANGAGLGGKKPNAGDPPDIWIGVDLTKPTARIVSAAPGVDSETGRLIISWQADDQYLAARPVSLAFSEDRAGPWTTIANGLENTGRYAWALDRRTPPRIYLRLEVRDEAGNIGVHETTEPVIIDQSIPNARIRDVRSLDQKTTRPEWRP